MRRNYSSEILKQRFDRDVNGKFEGKKTIFPFSDLKEDVMNSFSSFLFEIRHVELTELLLHQVRIVIGKSGFVMGGFVSTVAYYDEACNVVGEVAGVAAPVLLSIFDFNHFVNTGKQGNIFVVVFGKPGAMSCI